MKRVTPAHHTDRIGVHSVAQKVHQHLGWLLRPQEVDYGIDAIIEVVIDGLPTGKMIAAQIKSGPSYFKEANEIAITFRGKLAHLDYWLNHDLPVIVVLYDPKDRVAYWQSVTPSHIIRTPAAWKMSIPRNQQLEFGQAAPLEAIAAQNEHFKAVASEFTCPHCGAALLERAGGDIDYESYACGYLIQDVCQRPCPSDPAFPKYEEYTPEFNECGSGTEKHWLCIPVPATSAAKRLRLSPASGRTKEEAEQQIRVEYDRCRTRRGPLR
jgi:predicted RNA-binding Zn-ribbon protein involved in translation (DUF1610 family)